MKTMKKTAAAGIALAATAGLVAGPVMMTGQAWAAGEQTGDITINKNEHNGDVSYGAIQIFKADVNADGKLSNVDWASDTVKTALTGADAPLAAYADKTAQEAVEYVGKNLGTTGTNAILADTELGMKIADAVKGLDATELAAGTKASLGEGYWVIMTSTAAGTGLSATSPIFAVIGDTPLTIAEKTTVPTLTKQIKEDKTGAWGKEADHTLGQEIEYQLTGTVSQNLASFETYQYNFVDVFGEGLGFVEGSVVVKSGDTTFVKDADYTVTYDEENRKLEVKFANLKGKVAGGASITCEYKATQNGNSAAADGIANGAYVEYTHSPTSSDLSKTTEDSAKDYSYALKVIKTDNATGEAITDVAKFTIQAKGGKYIGLVDGKIAEVDTPYEFETADGIINISGIDADTYVITETQAPASYQKLTAPFEVTIDATDRKNVTKQVTADPNTNKSQSTDDGIKVPNVKDLGLPVTGEQLGLIILCAGVGITILSGASIAFNRARNRNED